EAEIHSILCIDIRRYEADVPNLNRMRRLRVFMGQGDVANVEPNARGREYITRQEIPAALQEGNLAS
ncbi:hypothetical protein DXG01_000661, partial [Tephrocybe rancida]